jgi:hypothetical protein
MKQMNTSVTELLSGRTSLQAQCTIYGSMAICIADKALDGVFLFSFQVMDASGCKFQPLPSSLSSNKYKNMMVNSKSNLAKVKFKGSTHASKG